MTKTADAGAVSTGDPAGFTLTLINAGPGTAKGAVLTDDPLPGPGLAWAMVPAVDGCALADGKLSCAFGDLEAAATRTVHLTSPTTAGSAGTLPNTAVVTATNLPGDCTACLATASITVQARPFCLHCLRCKRWHLLPARLPAQTRPLLAAASHTWVL